MKKLLPILFLFGCSKQSSVSTFNKSNASVTPSHIIVIVEENHGYDEIIKSKDAPYINSLADSGILFTNFHGVTHPSQPNYIALFSGDQQGVTDDKCISKKFTTENLYTKLKKVGKTCAWYSEDLPLTNKETCNNGLYYRKHNPIVDFTKDPDNVNKAFSQLDTNNLENLVFIVPNINNDMHNGTIAQGDTWLQQNCKVLADYCKTHNGIFIVTYDEDEHTTEANQIPVIFYGANVSAKTISTQYDHYNLTKTICSLFGASTGWTSNLKSRKVIKF